MPTVSVIVPVYNVEKYIHRCVDSILVQTFTDFELILVDDGSPDNCPSICDDYAVQDGRVKVLHLQNGGVSRARNAGLDVATGIYIAFCDSDDWWEPQLLERAVEIMKEGKWDWVSYCFQRVGDLNRIIKIQHPAGKWNFLNWEDRLSYLFSNFLQCRSGWEVWTRLFRNELIENNKIRFCETCHNFAEDLGFCVKYLLCANSVTSIEDCLYNYYLRDNSMMASSREVIKLNELNEVSYDVALFAQNVIPHNVYEEKIGILHYQIMYNQFERLFFTERYRSLPDELGKIQRISWFRKGTRATIRNRKIFQKLYGSYNTYRTVNFSFYCLHRVWWLYVLIRRTINLVRGMAKIWNDYMCRRTL